MRHQLSCVVGILFLWFITSLISVQAQNPVQIRYSLWDAVQQPAYEECAAVFEVEQPNIDVVIEQFGWNDYWAGIEAGFVNGTAPDVFTNHLAKYPELVAGGRLVDIQPLVERDQMPTDIYIGNLTELWMRDSKRYGLPKDWDTIAVVYNVKMLEDADIDPVIMGDWTWNAQDGGSFGETIAALTLDENGNNGLSPNFDKTKVIQYGFIPESSGGFAGQSAWSHWAVSNGFAFNNDLWGDEYYYDDPRLIETMQWFADLNLVYGFAPPYSDIASLGSVAMFQAGQGAMTTNGSWQINNFVENSPFEVGFGLLPIGPEGRKSMFNGLSDSIWVGTQHPEEAWEWLKFAASPACETIVGKWMVAFPATPEGTEITLQQLAAQGIDVSAFTFQALDPEGTFLFPLTDYGADIAAIMGPTMDSIMLGERTAKEALTEANAAVNALFD
jgi:multiple sugar transport system substrate-binding protein